MRGVPLEVIQELMGHATIEMAQRAGPGEVVVGDTTHRLVSPIFETVPLGERAWEGTRPLTAHRVVRARQEVLRFERALAPGRRLSPWVGREREVEVLLGRWERARRGQGSFFLVEGEAGIGKSRLLQEVWERVSGQEVLHIQLQCWSQFSTSAFHPLIEALRRLWEVPGYSPGETLHAVESWLEGMGLAPVQVRRVASLMGLPVAEDSPHLQLTPERRREETLVTGPGGVGVAGVGRSPAWRGLRRAGSASCPSDDGAGPGRAQAREARRPRA
jgi:AAA ATPase domain